MKSVKLYKMICNAQILVGFLCLLSTLACSQPPSGQPKLQTGADQMERYLPLLKNQRVGLLVNQTSVIGQKHLVDTLLALKINVVKIFSPEHGFRGTADAGEKINSGIDETTGLPIVSLYGKNKKPSPAQLSDVDILLFDIQDVGARFYTYISSMHYLMQACAENHKPLLLLDRPNPNGHYIDGPVLDLKHKSFVGMHPIPIVHGLTVGELAQMIQGEKWLDSGKVCQLTVIPCANYTHKMKYLLPVRPSPNLANAQAIGLYPSLCLFEGTPISVGRGTDFPFQVLGAPSETYGKFTFTPVSRPGSKNNTLHENQKCYGLDLRKAELKPRIELGYLITFYKNAPDKSKFFIDFFDKLAGNSLLKTQIQKGISEEAIRLSWQAELKKYKSMRKKYLLYEDFE